MYAVIIFLIALATLEGALYQLIQDILRDWQPKAFHCLAIAVSAFAAAWELSTLAGLEGVVRLFASADHIILPSPFGTYESRRAYPDEIPNIHALADRLYPDYKFTIAGLTEWHRRNPTIFFVMIHDGELVGYMDAFPISRQDFDLLAIGEEEAAISPQSAAEVSSDSVFYIASVAISPKYVTLVDSFLRRAVRYYSNTYRADRWTKICALAETPNGLALAQRLGMTNLPGASAALYAIKLEDLPAMSPHLRRYWRRLL